MSEQLTAAAPTRRASVRNHPNTVAGTSGASAGILIVWIVGLFGVDMTAEVGAAIAALMAAVVLALGRGGLIGIKDAILYGWRKAT